MSKKNKNKQKFNSQSASAASSETVTVEEKGAEKDPTAVQEVDFMKRELRNLAIIVVFLIALLFALYFYNKQTHILQYLTTKLFSLF